MAQRKHRQHLCKTTHPSLLEKHDHLFHLYSLRYSIHRMSGGTADATQRAPFFRGNRHSLLSHHHKLQEDERDHLRPRLQAESYEFHSHRSEEHTSELQSRFDLVCRLLLEKKKKHITKKKIR